MNINDNCDAARWYGHILPLNKTATRYRKLFRWRSCSSDVHKLAKSYLRNVHLRLVWLKTLLQDPI